MTPAQLDRNLGRLTRMMLGALVLYGATLITIAISSAPLWQL